MNGFSVEGSFPTPTVFLSLWICDIRGITETFRSGVPGYQNVSRKTTLFTSPVSGRNVVAGLGISSHCYDFISDRQRTGLPASSSPSQTGNWERPSLTWHKERWPLLWHVNAPLIDQCSKQSGNLYLRHTLLSSFLPSKIRQAERASWAPPCTAWEWRTSTKLRWIIRRTNEPVNKQKNLLINQKRRYESSLTCLRSFQR